MVSIGGLQYKFQHAVLIPPAELSVVHLLVFIVYLCYLSQETFLYKTQRHLSCLLPALLRKSPLLSHTYLLVSIGDILSCLLCILFPLSKFST